MSEQMPETMINQLESAIQRLVAQNQELKTEVAQLREQNETLQLEQMEKEENYAQQRTRLQQLLSQLNDI